MHGIKITFFAAWIVVAGWAGFATRLLAGELTAEALMFMEVPVVATASRMEQPVTEAPASVSIVTAEEIKKHGYRTLADILGSLRGFYITYDRNYNYVGVRGFGRSGDYNSRILLLVDGHRINDNIYDSAPVGTEFVVDVDLIKRVEVIRGPGSSLYGGNAFFAVVNVITRQGAELQGAEASGEAGSFETYKGRLTYGNKFHNGLEALFSGTLFDSQGDRLFFQEFNDPATNNGITAKADFDGFHNALAKLSYAGFTLEGLYSSRTKGVPTASFGADFNDPRNETTDEWWFLELKYRRNFKGAELLGRLFYDAYGFDGDYLYDQVVNKDSSSGKWAGGELQIATRLPDGQKLIAGLEYQKNIRQDQKNYDAEPFVLYIDDRRQSDVWALYIQDEIALHQKLILNAGVRYDHYSTFGGTVNPRAALIFSPHKRTTLKLLYGSAFRAPNVYELYYEVSGPDGEKGNQDLEPEKIRSYELTCEQAIGKNLRGTVTVFDNKISDLISRMIDPADDMLVYRNIGEVEAKGIEMELEGQRANGLTGRASYSFQETRDVATNLDLVNSPRHLAKFSVIVPLSEEKVFLGLEERFMSRRGTLAGNSAKPVYLTNLTLFSRDLLKGLEASASIYNLFDYDYGDPGGEEHVQDIIEQDGRTFRVKLTYLF